MDLLEQSSLDYHPQACQVSLVQLKNCMILKIVMAADSLEWVKKNTYYSRWRCVDFMNSSA